MGTCLWKLRKYGTIREDIENSDKNKKNRTLRIKKISEKLKVKKQPNRIYPQENI